MKYVILSWATVVMQVGILHMSQNPVVFVGFGVSLACAILVTALEISA